MKFKYTEQDFVDLFPFDNQIGLRVDCADKANYKIEEWLKECPLVCGTIPDHPRWLYELEFHGCIKSSDTHVAQLINIREIQKGSK